MQFLPTLLAVSAVSALAVQSPQSVDTLVNGDIAQISSALQQLTSAIRAYHGPANIPGAKRILGGLSNVNYALRVAAEDVNSFSELTAAESSQVLAGAQKIQPLADEALESLVAKRGELVGSGPFDAVFGPGIVVANLRNTRGNADSLGAALEGVVAPPSSAPLEEEFAEIDAQFERAIRAYHVV